ncbi:hypothetical protein C0J52_16780 [Blattella germanica]|nr:hypothetical protein C0J52_16780 [Blattella germanica]
MGVKIFSIVCSFVMQRLTPLDRLELLSSNARSFHIHQRAFCVLEFDKSKSATDVQRKFRTKFNKEAPSRKSIYAWHDKFVTTGCLCPKKRSGRPTVSEETINRKSPVSINIHLMDVRELKRANLMQEIPFLHMEIGMVINSTPFFEKVVLVSGGDTFECSNVNNGPSEQKEDTDDDTKCTGRHLAAEAGTDINNDVTLDPYYHSPILKAILRFVQNVQSITFSANICCDENWVSENKQEQCVLPAEMFPYVSTRFKEYHTKFSIQSWSSLQQMTHDFIAIGRKLNGCSTLDVRAAKSLWAASNKTSREDSINLHHKETALHYMLINDDLLKEKGGNKKENIILKASTVGILCWRGALLATPSLNTPQLAEACSKEEVPTGPYVDKSEMSYDFRSSSYIPLDREY